MTKPDNVEATIDQGITTKQFLAELKRAVDSLGGPAKAGAAWGVAAQHISSAITGNKLPVKKILKQMGYVPVKEISYRYMRIKS